MNNQQLLYFRYLIADGRDRLQIYGKHNLTHHIQNKILTIRKFNFDRHAPTHRNYYNSGSSKKFGQVISGKIAKQTILHWRCTTIRRRYYYQWYSRTEQSQAARSRCFADKSANAFDAPVPVSTGITCDHLLGRSGGTVTSSTSHPPGREDRNRRKLTWCSLWNINCAHRRVFIMGNLTVARKRLLEIVHS